jgi:long-chain-fatty-acid--CoA ligase ACSBG
MTCTLLKSQLLCSLFLNSSALPAGIYTTNSADSCHYVAESCKANVIVVENKMQLDKILEVRV